MVYKVVIIIYTHHTQLHMCNSRKWLLYNDIHDLVKLVTTNPQWDVVHAQHIRDENFINLYRFSAYRLRSSRNNCSFEFNSSNGDHVSSSY